MSNSTPASAWSYQMSAMDLQRSWWCLPFLCEGGLIGAAASVTAQVATQVFIMIDSFPQAGIVMLAPEIAQIVCLTDAGDMLREERPSSHVNSSLLVDPVLTSPFPLRLRLGRPLAASGFSIKSIGNLLFSMIHTRLDISLWLIIFFIYYQYVI